MPSRFRCSAAVVSLLSLSLVTSCGGSDSTGPKVGNLSAQDTQAFVAALDEVMNDLLNQSNSFGFANTRSDAALFTVTTQNQSGSATTQCPKGGQASSTYTASTTSDDQTHNASGVVSGQLTFAACRVATNTQQYTVNGAIDIGATIAITASPFAFDKFSITYKGSISIDGTTCPIDAVLNLAPTASATGTVCGNAITNTR